MATVLCVHPPPQACPARQPPVDTPVHELPSAIVNMQVYSPVPSMASEAESPILPLSSPVRNSPQSTQSRSPVRRNITRNLFARSPDIPPEVTTHERLHLVGRSPTLNRTLSTWRRNSRSLLDINRDAKQSEVLRYLEGISDQQKQILQFQRQTVERLDALIGVLSGPSDVVPLTPTPVREDNLTTISMVNCPLQATPEDPAGISVDEETLIFQLRSKATSEKNFAVHLLRHFFQPSELHGRNVRAVGKKDALNPEKIAKIRELVFRYFPTSLGQQENLWRDCRRAIDSYLRNRKGNVRSV